MEGRMEIHHLFQVWDPLQRSGLGSSLRSGLDPLLRSGWDPLPKSGIGSITSVRYALVWDPLQRSSLGSITEVGTGIHCRGQDLAPGMH